MLIPILRFADATGPVQFGFTKLLKRAASTGALLANSLSNRHLRVEYTANKQSVTGVFTVPPHLHADVPIPMGFRPSQVAVHPANRALDESRGFLCRILERNQRELLNPFDVLSVSHVSRPHMTTICLPCSVPSVMIAMVGQDFQQRPHSAAEFKAVISGFATGKKIDEWVFDLLDFLEEHEAECDSFYTDATLGPFSWVKYHEAAVGGVIPGNFVAVGDAVMDLNPAGGN